MKPFTLTDAQKEQFKTKGGGILISEKRIGHVSETFHIDDQTFQIIAEERRQIYLLTKEHATSAGYDSLESLLSHLEKEFTQYHRNMGVELSCIDTVYLQYFTEDTFSEDI